MPELPEVETVRAGLERYLSGQKVLGIVIENQKSFQDIKGSAKAKLFGAHIIGVDRRAKVMMIRLSTGYTLLIHLKMTGQLIYRPTHGRGFGGGHPTDSLIGSLPDRSTRVTLELEKGKLFFNDQRKFGWIKLLLDKDIERLDFFKRVGPEPLESGFTLEEFRRRLKRRQRTSIKAAILDQSIVAGVGNIYADESLHAAKIHPATLVGELSVIKLNRLRQAIKDSLQISLDHGGSSDRNYVDVDGNKGSYLKFARVFRRDGQPCPVCGTIIEKTRVAGRGTHFCPKCQKPPKQNMLHNQNIKNRVGQS